VAARLQAGPVQERIAGVARTGVAEACEVLNRMLLRMDKRK